MVCGEAVYKHSVLVYCVHHSVLQYCRSKTASQIISHTSFLCQLTPHFPRLKINASLENSRVVGSIPPLGRHKNIIITKSCVDPAKIGLYKFCYQFLWISLNFRPFGTYRGDLGGMSLPLKTGPLQWSSKGCIEWQGNDIQTKTF